MTASGGLTGSGGGQGGAGGGGGGSVIDDDGNLNIWRYEPCAKLSETEREGNPLCKNMIEPIKVPVMPAIPSQETLSQKSLDELKRGLLQAEAAKFAAEMGESVMDKFLKNSPYSWLGGQLAAKALEDRLNAIIRAYETEIQSR